MGTQKHKVIAKTRTVDNTTLIVADMGKGNIRMRMSRKMTAEEFRYGINHSATIAHDEVLGVYNLDIKLSEETMFELCRLYLECKHGTKSIQQLIEFKNE